MVTVYRVSAVWQNFIGAPGYSRFSFQDLSSDAARNAAGAAIHDFFNALASHLPANATVQVQNEVQEFDMTTGILTGAVAMSQVPALVTSTAPATAYAGGAGYCITWKANVIFNGRRVQGRTFMVPTAGVFESNGSLGATAISAAQNAANALIAATGAELAIWSRVWDTQQPPNQIGGALSPVSTAVVKDQASQLRTRRL